MSVTFSEALRVQRELFSLPKPERAQVFLQRVLEPMKPAFMPPPGVGPGLPDLLVFARQSGCLDPDGDPKTYERAFALLDEHQTEAACRRVLREAESALQPEAHGIADPIAGHVMIADPLNSAMIAADDGYTGYGGHSGHGIVHVDVSEGNVARIPAALAHEYHHNIRLRYERWTRETTIGQYMIVEGLAEAFAVELCGEERAGPWVTRQTPEERAHARGIFADALETGGWNKLRAYIFGDWMAPACNEPERGLVRSAGYAVGFDCVRAYCANTGRTAAQATYVPWREIVTGSGMF